MALYFYQALSRDGKKVSGSLDASSLALVREHLVKNGMYPTHIALAQESSRSTSWSWRSLFTPSVSLKDTLFFTKQLAVLLRSGVPLLAALELLIEQTSGGLKAVVIELKDGIKEGRSLADGLAKYPKIFENLYVQLVRAGEASGKLEFILERLTGYLERQQELRKKIRSALTLPIIQLGLIVVVVCVLLVAVVPEIAKSFTQKGAVLPLPTRILLGLSSFVTHYYLIMILGAIIAYTAFRFWRSTPRGGQLFDTFLLKIPLFGNFIRMRAIIQFSQTLGMLLAGGVNLSESLTIVCNTVDNTILAQALLRARENIIKQGRVTEYLKQTSIFPPVALYLINTGEQSGTLDQMLLTVAKNYEDELEDQIDVFTKALDPLLIIIMALVVGFVIFAIVLPMMQRYENLG